MRSGSRFDNVAITVFVITTAFVARLIRFQLFVVTLRCCVFCFCARVCYVYVYDYILVPIYALNHDGDITGIRDYRDSGIFTVFTGVLGSFVVVVRVDVDLDAVAVPVPAKKNMEIIFMYY